MCLFKVNLKVFNVYCYKLFIVFDYLVKYLIILLILCVINNHDVVINMFIINYILIMNV